MSARHLLAATLLLVALASPLVAAPGDLDNDTDVDLDDIAIILAAVNTPAAGPADPKDLDSDGTITVLDARIAVTLCTRPLCATGNNPPTITALADQTTLEDTATGPLAFTIGDPDGTPPGTLAVTATSADQTLVPDANLTLGGAGANRTIDVLPGTDQNGGPVTITVTVDDNSGAPNATASTTFDLTVTAVNDAPSFTAGPDPMVSEDAGPQNLVGWATGISPGPADEAGQTLTFNVTNNTNPGLFAAGPTVSANGDLAFTSAVDANGSADVTIELMDDGGTANGGVDTSPPQTFTITVLPVNDPPVGGADSFDFIGNTELRVDLAPLAVPLVSVSTTGGVTALADGVLDNDSDPEGSAVSVSGVRDGTSDCGDTTAPFTDCPTANGGRVTVEANGQFRYVPAPGDTAASDSFEYRLFDGTDNVIVAVTLNRFDRVWYVDNSDVTAPFDGTSVDPFDTLAAAAAASLPGDTIFVHRGDGTSTGQDAGIVLQDGQKLIGEGIDLAVDVAVNGNPAPTLVFDSAANLRPSVEHATAASDGVTVLANGADHLGVEIRGLALSGTGNAIDVTAAGTFAVGVTITDNLFVDSGAEAIDLNPGASGLFTATIASNTFATTSPTGNGIDVVTAAGAGDVHLAIDGNTDVTSSGGTAIHVDGTLGTGTLYITGFADNTVHGNTGGGGILIKGATFDATPGGGIDIVGGGNTSIGVVANPVTGAGLVLDTVRGGLIFTQLTVDNTSGSGAPGVRLANLAPLTAGDFGLGIGAGAVHTAGGPALDLDPAMVAATLGSVTSTGSPGVGVRLKDLAGSVTLQNAAPGTSISGAAGAAFEIDGGSVAVQYNGNITQANNAPAVFVHGGHLAGLVTFQNGTVSATNGTGLQFDNADSTYQFTGTVTLNGGDAGIDILNGSDGSFTFGTSTSITSPSGPAFNLVGGTASVVYSGNITQASNASAVAISGGHATGTVTFQTGTIAASGGNGLQFDNADSASYQFTGTVSLAGSDAGIDILNGSGGNFTFGSSTSITSPSGPAFNLVGGTASVVYSGNVTQANNAAAVSVSGGHTTGTVTFQTGTVSATGGTGLQFNNADSVTSYNFTSTVTLAGGDAGIDIVNGSAGTFNFGAGTTITSPSGAAFVVDSSSATVDYAGSITQNSAAAGVAISGNTGTVTFRGGLALNTGSATAFSATGGGLVNVCADDNCSTAGGTAVVNTVGAATPVSGNAVTVSGTAIGPEDVTFRSIAVDGGGGTSTAIVLANTGAGQFHVTGTGAAGSGGTLENIVADAVTFSNTGGRVTFEDMILQDIGDMSGGLNTLSGHDAIHGEQVDGGLTLDNVTIRRISDDAIHGEPLAGPGFTTFNGLEILSSLIEDTNRYHDPAGCSPCGDDNNEAMVRMRGLKGTVRVIGSTLRRGAELLDLSSTAAGGDTLALTVQSSSFNDSFKGLSAALGAKGLACINVKARGDADAIVHIGDPLEANGALGNTFTGCATVAVAIKHDDAAATGDVDAIISRNTLDNSAVESPPICCGTVGGPYGLGNWPQNSILLRARGTTAATMDAIVSHNTLTTPGLAEGNEGSITVFHDGQTGGTPVTAGTLQARISDNTIIRPFVAGVFVVAENNTAARVLVEDNEIVGGSAMHPDFGATPVPGNSSKARTIDGGSLDVTVRTHGHATSVTSTSPGFPEQDVVFTEPLSASFKVQGLGNPSTLCASLSNNTSERGYELREDTGSAVSVFRGASGLTSCTTAAPVNCETVLGALGNTGGPTGGAAGSGNPALAPPDVAVTGTSGVIDLTATACPLPSGSISGGSF